MFWLKPLLVATCFAVEFGFATPVQIPLQLQTTSKLPKMRGILCTFLTFLYIKKHNKNRRSCKGDSCILQTCIPIRIMRLILQCRLPVTGRRRKRRRIISLGIMAHLIRPSFIICNLNWSPYRDLVQEL